MSSFETVIRDFIDTLDASRDFLITVGPVVLQKHEKMSKSAMDALGSC